MSENVKVGKGGSSATVAGAPKIDPKALALAVQKAVGKPARQRADGSRQARRYETACLSDGEEYSTARLCKVLGRMGFSWKVAEKVLCHTKQLRIDGKTRVGPPRSTVKFWISIGRQGEGITSITEDDGKGGLKLLDSVAEAIALLLFNAGVQL